MTIRSAVILILAATMSACGGKDSGSNKPKPSTEITRPDNPVIEPTPQVPPTQPLPTPVPTDPETPEPDQPENELASYYLQAAGKTGYELKTALSIIIANGHQDKGYNWTFVNNHDRDVYFEGDGSILDIYSENPTAKDPYNFMVQQNQCGNSNLNQEGVCYNREHAFPQTWFNREAPMVSDVHHVFATDRVVNGRRASNPYGNVTTISWASGNGSLLGFTMEGYNGRVFEPIDEFKGDVARAYFYMATRYQEDISEWQGNSNADSVLNGTADQVFDDWQLAVLKNWHQQDPVSEKERDRNTAAYDYQGNRNPFIDQPDWVYEIWGNSK